VYEALRILGIHAAADVEGVKELLRVGAPVDARDEGGRTALHAACGYADVELVEVTRCISLLVSLLVLLVQTYEY
jgi:ankyrin repeat protein